jgi:hypothetical protein
VEEENLQAAVEAQAAARVKGNIAAFAAYMTPQALLRMHRAGSGPRDRRSNSYQVLSVDESGDAGRSELRFRGVANYVLRTRWERRNGVWKAVMVETPPEGNRPGWWKRMLRAGASDGASAVDGRDSR